MNFTFKLIQVILAMGAEHIHRLFKRLSKGLTKYVEQKLLRFKEICVTISASEPNVLSHEV